MKTGEAKIRREGLPLTVQEAKALLDFIDLQNPSHDAIEPEIVVKLELQTKAALHPLKIGLLAFWKNIQQLTDSSTKSLY